MVAQVSVVIPTYNRCELLKTAIESCYRGAQGLRLEVVVIDDASKEDVQSIASQFDVHYVRLANNSGSSVARNTGVAVAQGDYVKFLDSDDVLVDGALAQEYLKACEVSADIVVSGWQVVDLEQDGRETVSAEFPAPVFTCIADDLLWGVAVPTSSALYHRQLLDGIQWDPELSKLNDWDFFVSAALASKRIATLQLPAYRWRQHSGERIINTSSFLKNAKEFFRILEKLEGSMRAGGDMTRARELRLAQYLYKELRGAYRFEPQLGRRMLEKILDLDAGFVPIDEEQSVFFRLLGRLLPLHPVLSCYGTSRRFADRAATIVRPRS